MEGLALAAAVVQDSAVQEGSAQEELAGQAQEATEGWASVA